MFYLTKQHSIAPMLYALHLEVVHDVDLLLLGSAVLVQPQQLSEQAVQGVPPDTALLQRHRHLGHLTRNNNKRYKYTDMSQVEHCCHPNTGWT